MGIIAQKSHCHIAGQRDLEGSQFSLYILYLVCYQIEVTFCVRFFNWTGITWYK